MGQDRERKEKKVRYCMKTTDYAGIDYGFGRVNIDHATGIRYGVISQDEVLQAWSDESEPYYGIPHCPKCGNEVKELSLEEETKGYEIAKYESEDYVCEDCKYVFGSESAFGDEPVSFDYEEEGYSATQAGDDTDIFILKSPYFTYAQFCSPCAPGAGHLGNPMNKETGVKTYCFGHDWFEEQETNRMLVCSLCKGTGALDPESVPNYDEKRFRANGGIVYENGNIQCWACSGTGERKEMIARAPYPVYSVETGELVEPEKE